MESEIFEINRSRKFHFPFLITAPVLKCQENTTTLNLTQFQCRIKSAWVGNKIHRGLGNRDGRNRDGLLSDWLRKKINTKYF